MCRIRVFSIIAALVFVLGLTVGPATAQPIKTNLFGLDGLFMATGGTVIPSGELIVGGSALVLNDDDRDLTSIPLTVTYGVSDQVEVAGAFEIHKSVDNGVNDDSGSGDLYLAAKYAVQEENADYPATALGLRLKLPMADEPLSSEETDVAVFAAAQMDMKSVTGVLNVEYLMPGGDAENQVIYVVGLEIPYSDTTDFSLEIMDQDIVGDLFAAGATFDMGSSLNFGVAIGLGLNDPSADFAAMGKISFTF